MLQHGIGGKLETCIRTHDSSGSRILKGGFHMPIGIFFGSARRPSVDPQRMHGKIISYYQEGASYIVST